MKVLIDWDGRQYHMVEDGDLVQIIDKDGIVVFDGQWFNAPERVVSNHVERLAVKDRPRTGDNSNESTQQQAPVTKKEDHCD